MSDRYEPFLRQLRIDLVHPLPGRDAQQQMAPRPRLDSSMRAEAGPESRQGGVLVLFYPHVGQIYFPLILRPTYSGVHSGQVGLPGGGYEEIDEGMEGTALRETYELIDVTREEQRVLGTNVLSLDPSTVISQPTSVRINAEMRARGIEVIEVPYSEPPKTGGSFRCSTLPLHRGN